MKQDDRRVRRIKEMDKIQRDGTSTEFDRGYKVGKGKKNSMDIAADVFFFFFYNDYCYISSNFCVHWSSWNNRSNKVYIVKKLWG